MRKRLIERITKSKRGSLGYTLTEMMVVVGIIAVLCAIAIPSIFAIRNSLRFAQANDYAKSIFLAAQQNLTEMRSDGGLGPVRSASGAYTIPGAVTTFPDEYRTEYVYTVTGTDAFNRVLPPLSVDADIRSKQIVIEYNPITGNVYSVFYYSKSDLDLDAMYQSGQLPRDKEHRKDLMVGYYDGSGLNSSQIELEQTQASVEFINGEEGIIQVLVPMPESFFGEFSQFAGGLDVVLEITGDYSTSTLVNGEEPVPLTINLDESKYKIGVDGKTVILEFPIDSLANRSSFVNYASHTQASAPGAPNSGSSLTTLTSEDDFKTITTPSDGSATTVYQLLPGENITIQAIVDYNGEGEDMVRIAPGILSGVNPMFEYLQPIGDNKYVLAVSNGRNLQNLNAIAPTIAKMVDAVVFTSDIYWNDTVAYYNENYGNGSTYSNTNSSGVFDEAPARALPYFVPIHHEDLFGTARFIFPGAGDGGLGGILDALLGALGWGSFNDSNVPTLTDEMDTVTGITHASIQGNGHGVYNLNVDSTKYQIPNEGVKKNITVENADGTTSVVETDLTGTFYATGENQKIDYYFTGLFGYVNTPINALNVVNPIIKGHEMTLEETLIQHYIYLFGRPIPTYTERVRLYNNPATGALVGAGGFNTLITNCSTYIDKTAAGYMNLPWGPRAYSVGDVQNWYGVSGEGAVGGLVGYAKSHRNVSGELTDDEAVLAFSKCFAAVPVSGNMRTTTDKNFGYSNGVGSFIGNSQLTNFYNCYASGHVLATGCRVNETLSGSLANGLASIFGIKLDLLYNGRTSWGAGGFVGTSHGTRYTNCFATGNVNASSASGENLGAGGFVGFMSIDETFTYGNKNSQGSEEIAQRTVFTDCYSVGMALTNGSTYENFSGANGRIAYQLNTSMTYIVGDYFRLYAPYYAAHRTNPGYESVYIYRDSYFLSNYHTDDNTDQVNSSNCASADSYSSFVDMVGNHNIGSTWMETEIQQIKDIYLYTTREVDHYEGTLIQRPVYKDVIHNYDTEYFQKYPALNDIYRNLYDAGYSAAYWNSASSSTTHPYSMTEGARYPFTKLKNMDYYGDWPSKPSDIGMAYYETYKDTGKTHYYFDRNHNDTTTLSLREGAGVMVVKDGYAIFSADDSNLTVTIGSVSDILAASTETYTVGKKTYHVFHLSDKLMAALPADGEFYVTVTAQHGEGADYTMYFNPNVAMSHVNPVEGNEDAVKPDAAPTTIYVRSARQFKGIATLQNFWSANYRYVQQLNINAADYLWSAGQNANVNSIGNLNNPFNASYSAGYSLAAGVDNQYQISGFQPVDAGFFGVIGAEGSVSNLIVECGNVNLAAAGTADYSAVVAGINNGTLDNVDLVATGNITVTANTGAGLLAGLSTGSAYDCSVTVPQDKTLTLSAPSVGGLIAEVRGTADAEATLTNCTASLPGTFHTTGAQYAGGLLGQAIHLNADQISVVMTNMSTSAEYAGGLVGYAEDSSFTGVVSNGTVNPVEVQINGTISSSAENGHTAGAIAYAKNTALTAVDVTVNTVSGNTATGFLGRGENADASNCVVIVIDSINGIAGASGVAGTVGPQSVFENVSVLLADVTITATNGSAAGYALEIQKEAYVGNCYVNMGMYSGEGSAVKNVISEAVITASADAAGYACVISGSVGEGRVVGCGEVNGANAGGFAVTVNGTVATSHISPAFTADASGYMGNSNSNLSVNGTNAAAGFALTLAKNATASNCYALCSVASQGTVENDSTAGTESGAAIATTYGFVGTNEGTINRCMANVDIVGGFGFAGVNNGLISTSYGWYNDAATKASAHQMTGTGNCFNCYFADLSPANSRVQSVVVYDDAGTGTAVTPAGLQTTALSGFNTGYEEYPYNLMDPADYLYPMLRNHYGNWLTPPQYAYGIAYYEVYEDGTVKMHLVDLSGTTVTEEHNAGITLDKTVSFNKDGTYADAEFNDWGTIKNTGYARFYNSEVGASVGTQLDFLTYTAGEFSYSFYAVEDSGIVNIPKNTDTTSSAQIDTRFADAIKENGVFDNNETYQVRTAEQLANIGSVPASFIQTHDIATVDVTPATIGTGCTYNGNGLKLTITGQTQPWLTTVDGAVQNLNLVVTGGVNKPLFETVNGSVNLTTVSLDTINNGGALVNNVNGTVSTGDITVDGAIAEGGKLFGDITAGGVQVTGSISAKDVSANAQLFGTVGASVTVTNGISVENVLGNVFGTVNAPVVVTNGISAADVQGQIFGDVSQGTVQINGTISAKDVTANAQIFGVVNQTVTVTKGISVNNVIGSVFGDVGATVTVTEGITASELQGKIFGEINAGGVQINGNILTQNINENAQLFGTVGAPVNVTGAIQTAVVNGQIFGNVGATVTTGAITTGQIGSNDNKTAAVFGDITAGSVTVDSISTGTNAVYGQVFGQVQTAGVNGFAVTVNKNIAVGDVNGMIFGAITNGGAKVSGSIQTGIINGQVFGDSSENTSITVTNGISVSDVNGKVFGNVRATVNTGAITAGQIGVSGTPAQIFGNIESGSVVAASITTNNNAVYGQIFGETKVGVTVTGGISTGIVSGKIVTAVSGGTFNPGGITVQPDADGNVPVLIGAVSGENTTVTGSTVNLNGGSLVGGLIESVIEKATVESFDITANNLGSSLVGDGLNGTLKNITLNCTTANVNSANGLLVGSMADGKIEGCEITVTGSVSTSATVFGGITGTVTKGTVSDNIVTVGTVSDNVFTPGTISVAASNGDAKFGGLVGEAMTGAAINGNTVKADILVTGKAGSLSVVGGLVGVNDATITGNEVTSNITYTQPAIPATDSATDSATIGGLVGQMNGGSISDYAEAGGSINLNGTDSKRTYIIGGAVGEDNVQTVSNDVEYQNVTVSVIIDADWATTVADEYFCPSGKGSIGLFVGHVHSGTFSFCSSDADNTAYQFLGTIHRTEETLTEAVYGNAAKMADNTTSTECKLADKESHKLDTTGYTSYAAGTKKIHKYTASLTECAFKVGTGETAKTKKQQINEVEYFYNIYDSLTDHFKLGTVNLPEFSNGATISHADFAAYAGQTNVITNYYCKVGDLYYRVYVTYSAEAGRLGTTNHTCELTYLNTDGIRTTVPNGESSWTYSDVIDRVVWGSIGSSTLYTLDLSSVTVNDDKYLIVAMAGGKEYVLTPNQDGSAVTATERASLTFTNVDPIYNGIFTKTGNIWTSDSYGKALNLSDSNWLAADAQVNISAVMPNGVKNADHIRFDLAGENHLSFTNNAFTKADAGSGNLVLYSVDETHHVYVATYDYLDKFDQKCDAVD